MELTPSETTQDQSDSEVHKLTKIEVLAPVNTSGKPNADQVSLAIKDIQEAGKVDTIGVVNLDPPVTSDDVMRAGGFGAMDGISSFLPVASDFTDFEANLHGAREYEDLNEEIHRPGLGWTGQSKE